MANNHPFGAKFQPQKNQIDDLWSLAGLTCIQGIIVIHSLQNPTKINILHLRIGGFYRMCLLFPNGNFQVPCPGFSGVYETA